MMSKPVLVVIAAYHNRGIGRAIESVKAQTFQDFECLVVQDGCQYGCRYRGMNSEHAGVSCDQCRKVREIVIDAIDGDPCFLFYILGANYGRMGWGPRNFALMNTNHPMIAYLDDDNWWEPNHLDLAVRKIKDGADFTWSGCWIYRDGVKCAQRFEPDKPKYYGIDTNELVHKRWLFDQCGGWRDDTKQYCTNGSNDWDMVARWLKADARGVNVGAITVNYVDTKKTNWKFQLKKRMLFWKRFNYETPVQVYLPQIKEE